MYKTWLVRRRWISVLGRWVVSAVTSSLDSRKFDFEVARWMGIALIAIPILSACTKGTEPELEVALFNQRVGAPIESRDIFLINNCRGIFEKRQVIEAGATSAIQMNEDVTIGEPTISINQTMRNFYGLERRSVVLTAPARRNIEFTVVWKRVAFMGTAEVEGDRSKQYRYEYYPVVDVRVIERELTCP